LAVEKIVTTVVQKVTTGYVKVMILGKLHVTDRFVYSWYSAWRLVFSTPRASFATYLFFKSVDASIHQRNQTG
jgi:hypothetical protein